MIWYAIEMIIATLGLAIITVVTRSFFMISDKELPMPEWLRRGLKYAPLVALGAVIVPELFMTNGKFIHTLLDARLPALAGAVIYYYTKRGILGTILVGMIIYLPLHIGLGW